MKSTLMKTTLFATLALIGAGSALAHTMRDESQTSHWMQHVMSETALAGTPAPWGSAATTVPSREIRVDGDNQHLRVTRFETIRLNFAGKPIDWTFDTLNTRAFDLSRIIPQAKGITVHIAENPDLLGG